MSDINTNAGGVPTPVPSSNSGDGQSASSGQPIDPFAGISMDDLPDDARAAIEKAKTEFSTLQKNATESDRKTQAAEGFARQQQSLADRARSVLQRHNLSIDGQGNGQQSTQLTPHDALVKQFVADGLKPEAAEAYAKMFDTAGAMQRDSILREMGPLASTVGGIQANQVLQSAEIQSPDVFKVPEVAKHVRECVSNLVGQGAVVDKATVDNIVAMAWGKHIMANPMSQPQQQQQQVPRFGVPAMNTGSHVTQQNLGSAKNAPVATQHETVSMMNAVQAEWMRGVPQKKK